MRIEPVLTVLALLLAKILALQDTEEVQTRLPFASIAMPRAVLLLVTFALGIAGGALGTLWWHKRRLQYAKEGATS